MTVSLSNPDGHVQVPLYHHVAVATGTKQVHIAGQVAWDADGNLVAAAGATFKDVVRFTWFAVDWQKEKFDAFTAGVEQAAREFDLSTPPAALIG